MRIVLVHIDLFFFLFVRHVFVEHVLVVAAQIDVFVADVVRMRRVGRFIDGRYVGPRFVVVALAVLAGIAQFLLGFFAPLPFHASILEPNFHLRFRQHQRRGHFEPLWPRQVFVLSELVLQFQQLLTGECRPRPSCFAQQRRRRRRRAS